MRNHLGISTPFDTLVYFEPNILKIIDEYLQDKTSHIRLSYGLSETHHHWFFAWGLSDDISEALYRACSTGELDDVKYIVSLGEILFLIKSYVQNFKRHVQQEM